MSDINDPNIRPRTMEDVIRDIAKDNPAIIKDLGGADKFEQTIAKIGGLDTKFEERGGVFFSLGSTPQETADRFTKIHIEEYRDTGRPSLPALVAHHLDDIGLSADSPHYKAAILVATRAEIDLAKTPQYHNTEHYADVTAHVAELLKRNNELAKKQVYGAPLFTPEEMADTITAAVGHDIEHPGGKNALPGQKSGEFDKYRLEEQSFKAMLPLMQEAGLPQKSIDEIHLIIMTTSPDGPHGFLKQISKWHQEGKAIDAGDPHGPVQKFPELAALVTDKRLTERAAILEDSDLGASAFEGMKSNVKMSQVFTEELQERDYRNAAGNLENLNGPLARDGFSKFVVGIGPASLAAQQALRENFEEMKVATQIELRELTGVGAAPAVPAAPAASSPPVSLSRPKTPGLG